MDVKLKEHRAELLSGREIGKAIKQEVADEVAELSRDGVEPSLTVVRVGEDPASEVYVKSKVKTAAELGIRSEQKHLPDDISQDELLEVIADLNRRDAIDGILVQLPLPPQIDERIVLESIDPLKDVDGFHPVNAGRLFQGHESLVPCTPAGIIDMLKRKNIKIAGQNAVVIGRSNIVGKPMAMLLMAEHATVTVCHSRTTDLAGVCSRADILVAAVGVTGIVGEDHIKPGATVVDVGMNRISDIEVAKGFFPEEDLRKRLRTIEKRGSTLVGDVNAKAAMEKAAYFTPVPGGVGRLTVAMLMKNTVKAARMRRGPETSA